MADLVQFGGRDLKLLVDDSMSVGESSRVLCKFPVFYASHLNIVHPRDRRLYPCLAFRGWAVWALASVSSWYCEGETPSKVS